MWQKILLRILKVVGIKRVVKFLWRNFMYPRLVRWTKSNDYPEWDEKLLDFVDRNIHKLIDLL